MVAMLLDSHGYDKTEAARDCDQKFSSQLRDRENRPKGKLKPKLNCLRIPERPELTKHLKAT